MILNLYILTINLIFRPVLARLKSCLDEIHNVVGDSFPEKVIIDAVILQGFDCEKSLNYILSSADSLGV